MVSSKFLLTIAMKKSSPYPCFFPSYDAIQYLEKSCARKNLNNEQNVKSTWRNYWKNDFQLFFKNICSVFDVKNKVSLFFILGCFFLEESIVHLLCSVRFHSIIDHSIPISMCIPDTPPHSLAKKRLMFFNQFFLFCFLFSFAFIGKFSLIK